MTIQPKTENPSLDSENLIPQHQLISEYFPELSDVQNQKIKRLFPLYEKWNAQINVISRKDLEQLYLHHVLHSLSIAKVIQFAPDTNVLDIGTGGGFPGIPLAIFFPEVRFHLVDSIGKKIKVVENIIEELELKNATAQWTRAEEVAGQYHFVVSRAVSYLKTLFTWSQKKISEEQFNTLKNGLLVLKGGDIQDELQALDVPATIYPISDYFKEEFFHEKFVVHVES